MIAVFKHVPDTAVVWTNDSRVYALLKTIGVGSKVCFCGDDGWPTHSDKNTLFVRVVNTPPPIPVSTFERGEIVITPEQIEGIWKGVEQAC